LHDPYNEKSISKQVMKNWAKYNVMTKTSVE
jgi:hypothetical protein